MQNDNNQNNGALLDEAKLHEFIEKVINEWGAAYGALLAFVADRLGLFKAMAEADALRYIISIVLDSLAIGC